MSIYLTIGTILFCLTHLYPVIFANGRQAVIGKIGETPYRGLYSLSTLFSLIMIIVGWRSNDPTYFFEIPEWGPKATSILMYLALFLFMTAKAQNNVKRLIRHPQLCSILLWGLAHLLSNGDDRSLVLFGIFAIWTSIMILLINRRDGPWEKPARCPLTSDLKTCIITAILYGVLIYGHGYYTGAQLISL
ncbi:MAG: hypothetical protein JKY45_03970 [Emcibacter sp.]|nr:hypothetical protein [Emcibacter sp.]